MQLSDHHTQATSDSAATRRVRRPWDRAAGPRVDRFTARAARKVAIATDEQSTELRVDTVVEVDPELFELEDGDGDEPGLEAVFDDPRRRPLVLF